MTHLTRFTQLPNKRPRPQIPQLDPPIIPTRHYKPLIKLQRRHRIIMRTETMQTFECLEIETDDTTVGSAGDEGVVGELELTDEGGVALEGGEALSEEERC